MIPRIFTVLIDTSLCTTTTTYSGESTTSAPSQITHPHENSSPNYRWPIRHHWLMSASPPWRAESKARVVEKHGFKPHDGAKLVGHHLHSACSHTRRKHRGESRSRRSTRMRGGPPAAKAGLKDFEWRVLEGSSLNGVCLSTLARKPCARSIFVCFQAYYLSISVYMWPITSERSVCQVERH